MYLTEYAQFCFLNYSYTYTIDIGKQKKNKETNMINVGTTKFIPHKTEKLLKHILKNTETDT